MQIFKSSLLVRILNFISCSSKDKQKPGWDPAVVKSRTMETILESPPDQVFPLFCPVREYEYMKKWTCTMRYSQSGFAEKNVVFQSGYLLPFWMKATWICTKYELNKAITYTVFIPDKVILLIENAFEKLPGGKTKHIVVYTGFGLSWIGNILVKKMFSTAHGESAGTSFKKELVYYLAYNRMML